MTEVNAVDAQTRQRGPSAEQPRRAKDARRPAPDEVREGEEQPQQKAPTLAERLRRHWLLVVVGAVVLLAALVCALLYWLEIRHYESTDDAFVAARSFSVASKVGGSSPRSR